MSPNDTEAWVFCQVVHNRPKMTRKGDTEDLKERLYRHFEAVPWTGCWLWTGNLSAYGYGAMNHAGTRSKYKAHRVSYEVHKGPIPPGMEVMHTCDVPACVNPLHLEVGTHSENMRQRDARKRQASGERCGASKLTKAQMLEVRESREMRRVIASKYGISKAQVYRIKSGECWADD